MLLVYYSNIITKVQGASGHAEISASFVLSTAGRNRYLLNSHNVQQNQILGLAIEDQLPMRQPGLNP